MRGGRGEEGRREEESTYHPSMKEGPLL